MTGVEAVSNGVKAFREPSDENARRTLTMVIALLIVLLAGIAWLVNIYQIGATDPGQPGYQSIISMLVAAILGRGIFYYVTIASVLLVLALSANTAFADFPRLCRVIALDRYLPLAFSLRGRRLVYSEGIYVLAALAGALLVIFGGVTDRLIPLFAVGAFLAFTLSQAGMVFHWRRLRRSRRGAKHVCQRTGSLRYRHYRAGRIGSEIRRGRMDYGPAHSRDTVRDGHGAPSLRPGGKRNRQSDSPGAEGFSARRWWWYRCNVGASWRKRLLGLP